MYEGATVSWAGYYRQLADQAPQEEEMAVRAAIQEIFVQHQLRYRVGTVLNCLPGMCGRRRMTTAARDAGQSQTRRWLMREDNLIALQRKPAQLHLSGVDQLWVADLTYIRQRTEFVHLAIVLSLLSPCGGLVVRTEPDREADSDCFTTSH
jgi:putative transposase